MSVEGLVHDLWFAFRLGLAAVLGIGWAVLVGRAGGEAARWLGRKGEES